MKSVKKSKVAARKTPRRRTPIISLSARVARLEREVLARPTTLAVAARHVNLGADGKPTTGDHVAVLDRQTGLVHVAAPLLSGESVAHADAMKACAELNLLGHKRWRPYTIQELLSIIDYTMHEPAVDKRHFKGPFGWTRTSTPYAARSGAARVVFLHYGISVWGYHDSLCQVRAVCAGQQLGLLE